MLISGYKNYVSWDVASTFLPFKLSLRRIASQYTWIDIAIGIGDENISTIGVNRQAIGIAYVSVGAICDEVGGEYLSRGDIYDGKVARGEVGGIGKIVAKDIERIALEGPIGNNYIIGVGGRDMGNGRSAF